MTTKLERLNDVFNRAFDVKVNINNHTDKKIWIHGTLLIT